MSEKGDKAKQLFEQGYNCSQSVVGAFADEIGLDFETAVKIASGFGGGMGRMRETCGAVTGAFMVAGMLKGYTNPKAVGEKRDTYQLIQDLAQDFKDINGSIVCKVLLGLEKPEGTAVPELRTNEYYKKRPCPELVKISAEILEKRLKL